MSIIGHLLCLALATPTMATKVTQLPAGTIPRAVALLRESLAISNPALNLPDDETLTMLILVSALTPDVLRRAQDPL